jgi:hypothetical protein
MQLAWVKRDFSDPEWDKRLNFWVYTDEELTYYDYQPTHWQPLPSPPPITPSAPHVSTEGQGITVDGIQGPHAHLNGTYAVDSVNPGTITP